MHAIADTDQLVSDQVITAKQARIIEKRARETMVVLAINSVLCFGIFAATGGLIFWLGSPLSVAIFGSAALILGLLVLTYGSATYRMFGNAAALIGTGMLLGGGTIEILDKYPDLAGQSLATAGFAIAALSALALQLESKVARFINGLVHLTGIAMHLGGVALILSDNSISGLPISLFYLYATIAIACAGWLIDVRLVTALAIVPFAQALDTGTFYFHAAYVFYSPEPTLSILQMSVLISACILLGTSWPERGARHARVLTVMALIVANLCALVGSLWGDVVGQTLWGPGASRRDSGLSWEQFKALQDAFQETALSISANLYALLWAGVLVLILLWAAHRSHRGVFNTTLTFAGIHAYTQLFENFADEPLAYVIGGLAAIPVAWGMWRLNLWMAAKETPAETEDPPA